jgi:hypothetical protein
MGLLDTNRAQRPTVRERTAGGITGPGKANVDKVYQQMTERPKSITPTINTDALIQDRAKAKAAAQQAAALARAQAKPIKIK